MSEPRRKENQRQAASAAKMAVAAKAVYWNLYRRGEYRVVLVGQVRHQPRDGGRDRPDSTEREQKPRTEAQVRPLAGEEVKAHAHEE